MAFTVAAGVDAFAGLLEFDVADEALLSRHGVVGPGLEFADLRFPDQCGPQGLAPHGRAEVRQEPLERPAQLVLGLALHGGIGELGLPLPAQPRYQRRNVHNPSTFHGVRVIALSAQASRVWA